MENKMDYKTAYNKIIDAYFKDEIRPLRNEFCFCGTLARDNQWRFEKRKGNYDYSREEYLLMEAELFRGLNEPNVLPFIISSHTIIELERDLVKCDSYETVLFQGMCNALEKLKEIHISRGEIIDEPIVFKKRQLDSNKVVTR